MVGWGEKWLRVMVQGRRRWVLGGEMVGGLRRGGR
jgi:hypothetical protein